jgi:uncharacterized protein YqgC (DUF456 family)
MLKPVPPPRAVVDRSQICDIYQPMAWLYFLLLLITDLIGLVLAAFTLPGLWLMLGGAAIYAWLTHGYYLSWKSLLFLLGLALIAEVVELWLGGAGAKKAGASAWGVFGGLIGGILGGIFFTGLIPIPILGTIIGICLGCFVGAFIAELATGQQLTQSAKIGFGAAKGKLTGIAGKVLIGLAMLLITFIAGLPIHGTKPPGTPATLVIPATAPTTR